MSTPNPNRLDRTALDRVLQRAAEMQASETDVGEGLTEREVLDLGQQVGIPQRFLQQAMLEERSRVTVAERTQLGLERVLDHVERGAVKPAHELPQRQQGLLEALASEVRRAIAPPASPPPGRKDSR